MLYGPNTNIVVNGSIICFSECEVRYVMRLPQAPARPRQAGPSTARPDVHDAYNAAIDAENLRMAWGASNVNSWYKNDPAGSPRTGRSRCSSSGSAPATVDPADYELI